MEFNEELKNNTEAGAELVNEELESVAGGADTIICKNCLGSGLKNGKYCTQCGGTGKRIAMSKAIPSVWIP